MDIGEEERTIIVEPAQDPVPKREPAKPPEPAPEILPEPIHVPAGVLVGNVLVPEAMLEDPSLDLAAIVRAVRA